MAILYTDDFESYATGSAPPGWYGIFKVQSATPEAVVSGSKAMLAWGELNRSSGVYRGIAARTQVNYLIKQKAQFNAGTPLLHSLFHADDQNSDVIAKNGYLIDITATSSSSVSVGFKRLISTEYDASYIATGIHNWSVAVGDIICQRLVVDGTTVKYTVWNSTNEAEPATPTLTYTDTTQRAAGYLYVVYNNGNAVATGFDDVTISDDVGGGGAGTDATAPGATVTGTGTVSAGSASGGGAATGAFTFDACENNTHSGILNNVAVNWTWLGGTVGSITSITNGSGTMTTAGMTISGVPTGVGCGIIRTTDGTVVAYQEGTVA